MSHSYLQKYRTFDELLESVRVDLPVQNIEGFIEPMQLIKIAQYVTYDLGLRIHQEAEAILDVEHNRAKLPNNFYVLNFALLMGEFSETVPVIHGRHTENVILPPDSDVLSINPKPCNVTLTKDGNYFQVVETRSTVTRCWKEFHPLKISSSQFVGKDCMNLGLNAPNTARIKDGFIYTNFREGKIYVHYTSHLEDEEGNLLVMTHPYIDAYYEYALKKRILENMILAKEPVQVEYQLIAGEHRAARNNALSFVNTPDFGELKSIWEANRKAMYNRYYSMFDTR